MICVVVVSSVANINIHNFFGASIATSMLVSVAGIELHANLHPYFQYLFAK